MTFKLLGVEQIYYLKIKMLKIGDQLYLLENQHIWSPYVCVCADLDEIRVAEPICWARHFEVMVGGIGRRTIEIAL